MRWGVYDVAFIGTSLTYGSWYWQDAVRAKMSASLTIEGLRFYDFGNPSFTISQLYDIRLAALRLRPRAFVIEAGMNDCGQPVPLVDFSAKYADYISAIRESDSTADIFVMTMNPAIPPAAGYVVANLGGYHQAVRDVAQAEGVGLIDNTPDWGTPTSAEIPDGVHPTTSAAQSIIVPNVSDALLAAIGA